jgi:hypothetical protein
MPKDTPSLVFLGSLGDTLDAVNAVLFTKEEIPQAMREEAAFWIADRQGLPGSYAGMFAPTDNDYAFGSITFTGEPVRSGAATGHILSEEACRVLFRLGIDSPEISAPLERARQAIFHRIDQGQANGKTSGVYCCGMCSVSLWRHLHASAQPSDFRRLENGLEELHRCRDGKGRWRRFPFFYTLLALNEMDLPQVEEEVCYSLPVIERSLRRMSKVDLEKESKFDYRRRVLLQNLLEKY